MTVLYLLLWYLPCSILHTCIDIQLTLDFCGRGGRGKSSKHSKTPCIQMKHGYSRTLFFSCTPRARVVSRVKKGYIPSYLAFVVVVVVVCMHLGYLFIPSPPLASSFSPHHLSIHPHPYPSIHLIPSLASFRYGAHVRYSAYPQIILKYLI
ncbi:hypothetical protein P167DRAFT_171853 [Morchella conica CCBAS932]|uniref:Uncharacterized protein n=1 Tax=Morchella conica CCBAS932 TaxID=1392247 RepID=A0A3N4KV96_9PEZI|nr:hypothetical protein P167DRAFT_171853 [Morchella conica CCBAS932]